MQNEVIIIFITSKHLKSYYIGCYSDMLILRQSSNFHHFETDISIGNHVFGLISGGALKIVDSWNFFAYF